MLEDQVVDGGGLLDRGHVRGGGEDLVSRARGGLCDQALVLGGVAASSAPEITSVGAAMRSRSGRRSIRSIAPQQAA